MGEFELEYVAAFEHVTDVIFAVKSPITAATPE